jgi:hypothetical protein
MDFRGLGLCTVSIVGQSADVECVGGRGSMVTCWGKVGGGGEDRGKMDVKGQKE